MADEPNSDTQHNEPDPLTVGLSDRATRRHHRVRSTEAAAAAGIVYAVLALLALLRLSSFPSLSLGDAELTAWFDKTGHRAQLIGALTLASVSGIAFLWFIAVIRRRLGDHEDQFFSTVFFGSGVAYVVVWLAGAASFAAPAVAMTSLDAAEVSPASASLAGGTGAALILVVAPRLQAVFVFSTSTVILRSQVLPSWLAVVGYLMGSGMFLIPIITQPLGLAFPAWVFIVSVVMLVNRPKDLMKADSPREA